MGRSPKSVARGRRLQSRPRKRPEGFHRVTIGKVSVGSEPEPPGFLVRGVYWYPIVQSNATHELQVQTILTVLSVQTVVCTEVLYCTT